MRDYNPTGLSRKDRKEYQRQYYLQHREEMQAKARRYYDELQARKGREVKKRKYKNRFMREGVEHVEFWDSQDRMLISVVAPDEAQVQSFKDIDRTTVFRKQVQHLPVEKVVRLLNDVLQDRRQYAGVR